MFSMYNYTQTINNEIDSVEESCVGVEADIEAYKLSVKDQSEARLRKQQELEEKLKATTEVSRRIQAQNQQQRECVDQLSKKVQSMFYKLQCDQLLSEPKTTLSLHGKKKTSHRGGGLMFRQVSSFF